MQAVLGTQYQTRDWTKMCQDAADNKWTWLYQDNKKDRRWSFCQLSMFLLCLSAIARSREASLR